MNDMFTNWKVVSTKTAETTPFVFKDRLYRLECFVTYAEDNSAVRHTPEDGCRIRDLSDDSIVSIPWRGHYYSQVFVWDDKIHIFGKELKSVTRIMHMVSDDLVNWSVPTVAIMPDEGESLYNTDFCWDGQRFVVLYETNDSKYPPFTFKYAQSTDLEGWELIDGALYGTDKYVGGPALYYYDGWYYTIYVNSIGRDLCSNYPDNANMSNQYPACYDSRITRSRDLITWTDSEKPIVRPNYNRLVNPEIFPGVVDINASDFAMCQWGERVIMEWIGGNQMGCIDMQTAEFEGTEQEFLKSFFTTV